MGTSKLKGLDEPLLEGGVGGGMSAGYRSARGANERKLRDRVEDMSPKERAALENPGKQFENPSPVEVRATEKARKYLESLSPKERAELENVGKQFEVKKKGGVVSASRRADGIAARGKTRGRMV